MQKIKIQGQLREKARKTVLSKQQQQQQKKKTLGMVAHTYHSSNLKHK
jgi:hypothetical protein